MTSDIDQALVEHGVAFLRACEMENLNPWEIAPEWHARWIEAFDEGQMFVTPRHREGG